MIRRARNTNECLSFGLANPEDVPIANCQLAQSKLFSLIPAANNCYFIRNGDTRVPPRTGRCLHVEDENAEELSAKACAGPDQQRWKLYRNPVAGTFNLINQKSGKCLDRDSGGASNAHMVDCNGSEWQQWQLMFIREN
jgi:hypothetical protein